MGRTGIEKERNKERGRKGMGIEGREWNRGRGRSRRDARVRQERKGREKELGMEGKQLEV